MSTNIYMYHVDLHQHVPRKPDLVLVQRLESLTGEDGACCATDLRAVADGLAATSGFARGLARARALGDERRLLALAMLKRRESMCGCELQAALKLTHATVSHHMGMLVDAGLVRAERRGKWMHYSLADEARAFVP